VLLGASDVYNGKFEVFSDTSKGAEFFWMVFATRNSIETEPTKESVTVNGDGPYRWIN
jgi:hypothetical protein